MVKNKKIDLLPSLEKASIIIRLVFIVLVFNLISCGKNSISWPAKIDGFDGFAEADQRNIVTSIDSLNVMSKTPFLVFDNSYEGNQKIYFKMVDKDLEFKNGSIIAAQALVEQDKCTIEVFPTAFRDNILKTVIWHELGHCSGLDHSLDSSDIMYYLVFPMPVYSQESVDRFIFNLSKSLK